METLCLPEVSGVSTNKMKICSNYCIIFLSAMDISSKIYHHNSSIQLEYAVFGSGEQVLVCFHGFGQNYLAFEPYTDALPRYRIVSVNLLFHGESHRTSDAKYLTHQEWKEVFSGLLSQLDIDRFSVLGYSMGGRYIASTIASFSARIDHCFFIAPDGIVKRRSYKFATFPIGPQQLFSYFMHHPQPFFVFLDLIERTKLMNPWTIKFSRSQLKDEQQRLRVLKCWITLKHLRVKQSELVRLINESHFKTYMIFGKYDRIIIPERHQSFFDQLKYAHISIIDSAHHELIDQALPTIKLALSKKPTA